MAARATFFEINLSGAMGDGLITSNTGGGGFGGQMNKSWDGIWLARVRRSSIGSPRTQSQFL